MARNNPGAFRRGWDPRRHVLTTEERRRGYASLMAGGVNNPPVYAVAWAWRKVRKYYRSRR